MNVLVITTTASVLQGTDHCLILHLTGARVALIAARSVSGGTERYNSPLLALRPHAVSTPCHTHTHALITRQMQHYHNYLSHATQSPLHFMCYTITTEFQHLLHHNSLLRNHHYHSYGTQSPLPFKCNTTTIVFLGNTTFLEFLMRHTSSTIT